MVGATVVGVAAVPALAAASASGVPTSLPVIGLPFFGYGTNLPFLTWTK